LPLGVQIIAPAGEDRMAIAVGAMLERSGAGYRAPPGTEAEYPSHAAPMPPCARVCHPCVKIAQLLRRCRSMLA
jgi:hypothetical protein